MSNRWLRFGIAFLAIGAAGAAGYRIFQQEQQLAGDVAVTRQAEAAAEAAVVSISELKAALHAYVAEGQGDAFWTARAATLIDRLRASILEVDGPATAAGAALTDTLDLTDRLASAEARAKEHVREGQRLMAGEVIFTDARDLLDAMRLQVVRGRTAVAQAASTRAADIRREQAMLAMGAAGILAFATLLLVIPGTSGTADVSTGATEPAGTDAITGAPNAPGALNTPGARSASASARGTMERELRRDHAEAASGREGGPSAPSVSLSDAAAVCTELGRVAQSIELSALLERAAQVLTASGAIVWMATADRHELYPAVSAGYDERLLTRIGSIKRDAANVTAAALRDAQPRTSARLGSSSAALAVPLMTPLGPVGVLSAEIKDVAAVDDARLAVATIFAAQLATLLGSMSGPAVEAAAADAPAAAKAQA